MMKEMEDNKLAILRATLQTRIYETQHYRSLTRFHQFRLRNFLSDRIDVLNEVMREIKRMQHRDLTLDVADIIAQKCT